LDVSLAIGAKSLDDPASTCVTDPDTVCAKLKIGSTPD
jgi:hypothetical protein